MRRMVGAVPLLLLNLDRGVRAPAPGPGRTARGLSRIRTRIRTEDLERLKRSLGLDQPLWRQYVQWLTGFVTGDWGFSYSDGRPCAGSRRRAPRRDDRARRRVGAPGRPRDVSARDRLGARQAGPPIADRNGVVRRHLAAGVLVRLRPAARVRTVARPPPIVRPHDPGRRRTGQSRGPPHPAGRDAGARARGRMVALREGGRLPMPRPSPLSSPRPRAARHAA